MPITRSKVTGDKIYVPVGTGRHLVSTAVDENGQKLFDSFSYDLSQIRSCHIMFVREPLARTVYVYKDKFMYADEHEHGESLTSLQDAVAHALGKDPFEISFGEYLEAVEILTSFGLPTYKERRLLADVHIQGYSWPLKEAPPLIIDISKDRMYLHMCGIYDYDAVHALDDMEDPKVTEADIRKVKELYAEDFALYDIYQKRPPIFRTTK